MLTLGVPTLNRYDMLGELFTSCENGSRKPDKYLVVDNGGLLQEMIDQSTFGCMSVMDRLEIHNPGSNIGVAASWNYIIQKYGDVTIICGDDTVMEANTFELLERGAIESEALFVYPGGNAGMRWSCFVHKTALTELIGPYDEKFYPAYFEDNDYHRRMQMGNVLEHAVPGIMYEHRTSSTVAKMTQKEQDKHAEDFRRNHQYYCEKWGGPPHRETFTIPFGPT